MSAEHHERPELANVTECSVKITYVVTGGKRPATARRGARKIASRLADAAARAAGVVDVTAVAGPSHEGEILWADPVRFPRANSGTQGADGLLDRYLDPDHDRTLRTLAIAREREHERSQADLRRRLTVGCRNPGSTLPDRRGQRCPCVYCQPETHEHHLRARHRNGASPLAPPTCLCGRIITRDGGNCAPHDAVDLVVLDRDPDALRRLAELHAQQPAAGGSAPLHPERGDDGR